MVVVNDVGCEVIVDDVVIRGRKWRMGRGR